MANGPNFNDPMYIHPSDTPGMNLVSDQLVGTDNYGVWSRAMLIALQAKNKIGFIDGTCMKPEAGSTSVLQWERCNALVLSWILNTVSREIFGGIVYATNASVVWTDLKEQFDKVNGSRIFALHRDIGRLVQGQSTISAYFCKLKQLWDEFASLVILPSCECAAAKRYVEHDQQHRLLQFLMGLNESYAAIRSQILMMSPLPTVGQAFSIISQEESHRSLSTTEPSPTVFYSNQNRAGDQRKDIMKCDYCNLNGHLKENCYKIVGYPPWHRLYRGQNRGGGNKRFGRGYGRGHRNAADVNLVENVEVQPLTTSGPIHNTAPNTAPVFTSAQYAEILKLLGNSNLQTSVEHVVNMAGPQKWEDCGDW
ncbi:uncharacterized protein [Primulina eburnea]|uniref:uncharacterized protein n=1 Tax=Primulina eburnea TaxID=1245227 RepID=UPI003C6BEEA3